ncbi:hypothetical protein PRIPAC_73383 [Pristionchus pacificus]|uniref:CUB domain-containing protein n=1 Tax=Pristionchus pacificus TaxID=54126 RepID=A0A2A6CEV5_PRIPA|nr:hypothetical protein PRIPAC_73383 [Pristionchus pacificus]|eukprot:PDM76734.1 CUB domain-containing protein [Pristionchus pacificus]
MVFYLLAVNRMLSSKTKKARFYTYDLIYSSSSVACHEQAFSARSIRSYAWWDSPGTAMPVVSDFAAVSADCPNDFDIVHDGKCAGKVPRGRCNWADPSCMAQSCNSTDLRAFNLKPVIIHSEEEQKYWTEQATSNKNGIFLDLGSCTLPPPEYYFLIWWIEKDTGRWTAERSDGSYDVFCIGQLPPLPSHDFCDDGFVSDKMKDQCYKIGSPATDFTRAQMACDDANADLASIHSTQENSFVRQLAFSSGATNGIFLGGATDENQTEFTWTDGTAWDYDNTYAGYPKEGNGECLLMDTFSSSGKWINADCSSKLPYVCVRPETLPVCAPGPWKEGDKANNYIFILKILVSLQITSPGYPYDASTACDYILSVDTGKYVEVTIEELQANSCCDQLLLTDAKFGGALVAKLSGQIITGQPKTFISASNFMRVSWQPNGGVNVKGFKMSYRAVDTREPTTTTTTTRTPKPATQPEKTTETTSYNYSDYSETTVKSTSTSETTVKSTSTTVLPTTTSGTSFVGSALMVMPLLTICLF